MAIKPVDNESFYREVDEELRREQLTGTWKRYGTWIVAGIILFLAAIAGFLYWQQQKEQRAGATGEQLAALFEEIQAGKTKGVEGKLDAIAKDAGPGYRAAATSSSSATCLNVARAAASLPWVTARSAFVRRAAAR